MKKNVGNEKMRSRNVKASSEFKLRNDERGGVEKLEEERDAQNNDTARFPSLLSGFLRKLYLCRAFPAVSLKKNDNNDDASSRSLEVLPHKQKFF